MIAAAGLTVLAGGRPLLRDIKLELRPGEVVAVIGPNGAGKSTLLRALAGELRPSHGTVLFGGLPLGRVDPRELARRRAVVSQNVELAFPMAARDVVMLGRLPWHGTVEAARDSAAVETAMEGAGIAPLAARAYATLSGGERQRVQIARALAQLDGATRPAAMLLDEPTASLDATHRLAMLRMLRLMAADGLAVLAVLHDLNEADYVADRVAMLAQGRLLALGPPAEVLRPAALQKIFGVGFRIIPGGGLLMNFGS